ncbi:tryptophan synthase subunit alpha [Pasteurellaceae bacterium 20609_3]|uniref:tryptophan synthase subunit alpha n=1 Tax=Spirabiliibacterium mucosae TaxID=28156 RepID=UPI001AAD9E84|nr:tryptophan synthase subunit alpha [Spirabiliibacterium mucosae]MBE2898593.1 tryptophan synthase subunit alpha [Spirabiliibacterium mucosae]
MSRFDTLFAALEKQGAFVPFVTLCDPTLERSFDIICTIVDNGADALELGFPFSDPLLDGPVIQAANNRALDAGFSTDACFELLTRVRARYPDTPISLLLCANLVYAQGLEHFYQRCHAAGVDAVLIADVPLMAAEPFVQSALKHDIQPVFICPPNADDATVKKVAQQSQGYTYLVSRAGVTSAENQQHASTLDSLIAKLQAHNAPAILQGFGIAKPEQVKDALNAGCRGAISGSAIVKIIERNLDDHAKCLQALGEFVAAMKNATR